MLYKVLKGRINGKEVGEIVELDEKVGKAYGEEYVVPFKEENEEEKGKEGKGTKEEKKEMKEVSNKALTADENVTKGGKGGK